MWLIINFGAPYDISGMAKARIVKLRTQVDSMKSNLRMTNHPWKGRGQGHITHFQFWCPQTYLWNCKSESFQIVYVGKIY